MWFKQLFTVTGNTLRITAGDSFCLVLHLSGLLLIVLLGAIPTFTQGDHILLLRDQSQALLFLLGCLAVTFGYIRAITDDIQRGAGPVLASRPVSASSLLLGRWLGVIAMVFALTVSLSFAYLWVSEIAHEPDHLSKGSLTLYLAVIPLALGLAALRQYLCRTLFVLPANAALLVGMGVCMALLLGAKGTQAYDWAGLQSAVMVFLGLAVFSAMLLPFAVLLDSAMVMSMGVILFFFGLISESLIALGGATGILRTVVKVLLPNWQAYWVADRLESGQSVPLSYVGSSGLHACLYLLLFVTVAVMLYERREITGSA